MTLLYNYLFKNQAHRASWFLVLFLFPYLMDCYSQTTVTSGTTMKIVGASSVVSTRNFVLSSGGLIDVQGTLILKQNLVNQNATANSLGSGAVVLSGTVSQTISGLNIIQDLTVNNDAGVEIAGDTKVNGVLTLTKGRIALGSNNLLLGTSASVAGDPSASNMVVATGSGELRKAYATPGSFTYPVGDTTGTPDYSPVTISFNSGTFAPTNYIGVNLVDAQYTGTETSYLTRYWKLSQLGITGFSCNSTFQYVTDDIVGNEGDIFCFKVNPAPFTAYNVANTGANQLSAHGLSTFSTFTGNLGNGTTPPAVRSLQDKTISDLSNCADASQTLLIAGNGTSYLVESGGNVKHIAGTNIIYYPGTKVVSGGYMHGYISPVFCSPYVHPALPVTGIADTETPGSVEKTNNSFFKIYPNPTLGNFTLELIGDVVSSQVHIEIFGMLGDRILSKDMQIDRKQEFSLIDKPTGVYVVRVTSGVSSETEKIIKR